MSYFIHIDLISSLLEQRLVDPGSTLIHVGSLVHTTLRFSTQLNIVFEELDYGQNFVSKIKNCATVQKILI